MASQNALLGIGRLNAFRLNYLPAALDARRKYTITITLDGAAVKVRRNSVTIHDVLNDAPSTCALVIDRATPPQVGQRLRVALGVDPVYVLFVGPIQASRESYVGKPSAPVLEWACEAIDDTPRADWLRPFGAWENVSASVVAQQLIASFAPGYTTNHVQAGLAPVTLYLDGSERMNGALRLIAKLIGGYYYFEDRDLHLFTGDELGILDPAPVDGRPRQLLHDPALVYSVDDSQIRTRAYGKGHSEITLAAVDAGETRLPIANAVMFNPAGGKAIIEWRKITYTGTVIGGDGALVGPGVTPTGAPVAAVADGAGIEAGAHSYAYTWTTAAGETKPSPIASVTLTGGQVAAPSFSVSQGIQFGGPPAGTVLGYRMFITDGAGGSFYSVGSVTLTITSNGNRPQLNFTTTADMPGRIVEFWRQDNGGLWAAVSIQNGPPGSSTFNPFPISQPPGYGQQWTDGTVSFTGGSAVPPTFTAGPLTGGQVKLAAIAVGPSGVTGRKVYRTAANLSALKLLTTLADNATLVYTDNKADATLGAAAPAGDTSGLSGGAGTVLPGSTSMLISGAGWVLPGGGWAVIGNGQQVIKYQGLQGGIALSGIPASGIGAITAAVNYGSTISGAPILLGVAGLSSPVRAGAPVNLWVQVDFPDQQAALAARVGGSGIVEQLIVDERRGEASLLALCTADLAMYSQALVTVHYTTFDPNTRAGRLARFHLPQLLLDVILTIQDVTIDHIGTGAAYPRFSASASSVRSSLEDILRRLSGTLEEGF